MKTFEIRVCDSLKVKDTIIKSKPSSIGVFVQISRYVEQVFVENQLFNGVVNYGRPPTLINLAL